MSSKKALWIVTAMLVILSLVMSACQAQPTEAPAPAPATEAPAEEPAAPAEPAEPAMPEASFPVMPGGFLEKALAGEYKGTTVTVDGPFTNPDDLRFFESVKEFEDLTGIKVNYIGDNNILAGWDVYTRG